MYDKEIRESLFFFLEESYGKSRILEEKVIGRARADCVLIQEDSFMAIEIKSDHDSYSRLEGQVKNYNQYFPFPIQDFQFFLKAYHAINLLPSACLKV